VTKSQPTFTVLGSLVPVDALDRRCFGEVSDTPHIRIDGVLKRVLAPDVLEASRTSEPVVSQTPGEGDIAVHISAWYFDSGVKLIAQESRLSIQNRVEWRAWRGARVMNRV